MRLSNNSHFTPQNESCWCQRAPVIVSSSPSPHSLCFCIAVSEAVKRAYAPCVIAGLSLSSLPPFLSFFFAQTTRRVTRYTLPPSSRFTFWAVVPWHSLSCELYTAADSDEKVLLSPSSLLLGIEDVYRTLIIWFSMFKKIRSGCKNCIYLRISVYFAAVFHPDVVNPSKCALTRLKHSWWIMNGVSNRGLYFLNRTISK